MNWPTAIGRRVIQSTGVIFIVICRLSQGKRGGEVALVTDSCPNWSENTGAPLQPGRGHRHFPTSGNRTQALQRFFPADKRSSYSNCYSRVPPDGGLLGGGVRASPQVSPLDKWADRAKDPHSTRVGFPTPHLGFSLIPRPRHRHLQIRNGKKHVSENCPSLVKHIQQAHPQRKSTLVHR